MDTEPDISSPWLIVGATLSGVATVVLTEIVYRSGLVRQDAALGLVFPLLFAISIILISRYLDDVHLDEDAVMVGEIGVAWADTNNHCLENCTSVTITTEDERANLTNQCTNCRELGISPRDEGAEFIEICTNCGTYTPGKAYQEGFIDSRPVQVAWPRSITITTLMTLLTVGFVVLFYKELKLSTFDDALAKALGFRPGVLHYALMVLVSMVAVGAFDAVGSILVIAFFIIPPAAAYLLTDRLSVMLILSALIGSAGAFFGYDLSVGNFLGILNISDLLRLLNDVFGLSLVETWDSSISASMVLMIFIFFLMSWILSPRYGLVSTMLRRTIQRRRFNNQVVLGHIYNHQHTEQMEQELTADRLHEHFRWSSQKTDRVLNRLKASHMVELNNNIIVLTPRGEERMLKFRQQNLALDA